MVYPCRFSAASRLPPLNQSSYYVLPLKQQPGFPLHLSVLSEPTSLREIIFPFHIWKCAARSNNTISNWCWGKCSTSLERKKQQQQIKKTQIMSSIRKCQRQNLLSLWINSCVFARNIIKSSVTLFFGVISQEMKCVRWKFWGVTPEGILKWNVSRLLLTLFSQLRRWEGDAEVRTVSCW